MVWGYRITTKWVAVGEGASEISERIDDEKIDSERIDDGKIDDEIPPIVFVAMPPKKKNKDKASSNHSGRKKGATGWKAEELHDALMTIIKVAPVGPAGWEEVEYQFLQKRPGSKRDKESIRSKYNSLQKRKAPTGDPSCPWYVHLALRAKRAIDDRVDIGFGEDRYDLIEGNFPKQQLPDPHPDALHPKTKCPPEAAAFLLMKEPPHPTDPTGTAAVPVSDAGGEVSLTTPKKTLAIDTQSSLSSLVSSANHTATKRAYINREQVKQENLERVLGEMNTNSDKFREADDEREKRRLEEENKREQRRLDEEKKREEERVRREDERERRQAQFMTCMLAEFTKAIRSSERYSDSGSSDGESPRKKRKTRKG